MGPSRRGANGTPRPLALRMQLSISSDVYPYPRPCWTDIVSFHYRRTVSSVPCSITVPVVKPLTLATSSLNIAGRCQYSHGGTNVSVRLSFEWKWITTSMCHDNRAPRYWPSSAALSGVTWQFSTDSLARAGDINHLFLYLLVNDRNVEENLELSKLDKTIILYCKMQK